MFSAEDQKKLTHWFGQIAERTKLCPACGRSDEAFSHPDLVCAPVAAKGEPRSLENSLHFLVRECRACGYVTFFNAERIGLRDRG